MAKGIQETIQERLSEMLGVDLPEVLPSAHIVNDLGADSLDVVEIVMAMEEEFDLEIPEDDAEKLHTVQDFIGYIQGRTKH